MWSEASMIGKTNVNVMPVLAYIGEVVVEDLEINPDEVEEAFVVSLQKLCDPESFSFTNFQSIILPSYLGGKHRVWGFTGAITHVVLTCLIPDVYRNEIYFLEPKTKKEKKEEKINIIQSLEVGKNFLNKKNTFSKI